MSKFYDLFQKKPVIGMLHLGGSNPIVQALDDLSIYEEGGLDAVIVEDHHGSPRDVQHTLEAISRRTTPLKVGVNVLWDFKTSFELANKFSADFIQIDSVQPPDIDMETYSRYRAEFLDLVVLGGVGFKGSTNPGSSLEAWLSLAKEKVDAIVTTGPSTGKETPLEKLKLYRTLVGDFPLVEGAGSDRRNVPTHFPIVDGTIVGSYYKDWNFSRTARDTRLPPQLKNVKGYMAAVGPVRDL